MNQFGGLTPEMWSEVGFVMFFLFAMVAVYFVTSKWWS